MVIPHYKKILLLILDGFGVASANRGNAISMAKPEHLNALISEYPTITLQASGPLVGLPWGEMGNSEVGHLSIGAGRIVGQDMPRINKSIQNGDFFKNEVLISACEHVKQNNSSLHLLGMVSSGGVHSYDQHLYALLGLAAEQGLRKVFIHMITDGRDTDQKAALPSLEKLNERIAQIGVGKIATVSGRFYAMDRGGHWEQTEMQYQAMVNGLGETANSPLECIQKNYARGIFDEMIRPTVIVDATNNPIAKVAEHDSIIFFNFRQDRAIQLTAAFVAPERMHIVQPHQKIADLQFVTMTMYMENLPVQVAFGQKQIKNYLGQIISSYGMRQFHVAESEKFAHVTSFFNGGYLDPLPGEDRLFVPSPNNTHNYIDSPEMSAAQIADALVDEISHEEYNFYVANFANADMVGHTGSFDATVAAVKAMDPLFVKLSEVVLAVGGCMIITADHGNAEEMIDYQTGEINKDHTTSPVPFIVIAKELKRQAHSASGYNDLASLVPEGALTDIAPTILELFGLPQPPEMDGISLLPAIAAVIDNQKTVANQL
jgi:2,3-bisphosphoglycerate-independent phosphoglycerate mutase